MGVRCSGAKILAMRVPGLKNSNITREMNCLVSFRNGVRNNYFLQTKTGYCKKTVFRELLIIYANNENGKSPLMIELKLIIVNEKNQQST